MSLQHAQTEPLPDGFGDGVSDCFFDVLGEAAHRLILATASDRLIPESEKRERPRLPMVHLTHLPWKQFEDAIEA